MNATLTSDDLPTQDLIDRIANALPADVRADYYRELMHCRLLPESDEMLRILRIMQFLTVLMEKVPDRLVLERKKLDQLIDGTLTALENVLRSSCCATSATGPTFGSAS